jgi:hypothetical protein
VTAVLAVASGCGGGDGGSSGSAASPETWAADICGAASTWKDDLGTQNESLQDTMSGASSIGEVRDRLVAFVDDAIERTDQMLSEIEDAGHPDIENGDQLAEDFLAVLSRFKTALTEARTTAAGLSDDPTQFAEGAQQIATAMAAAGEEIQTGLNELQQSADSGDLDSAFKDEPACQELGS